nr:MAG TPA: hypothetical protein [Caudoviricetes sp.]
MSYFDVIIFKLEQMKNSLNHRLMTANTIIKTPPSEASAKAGALFC